MEKKKLKNLKRGFVALLPIVLFIWILLWIFSLIQSYVSWIGTFISGYISYEIPSFVLTVASCVLLVAFVWLVGVIMNEKHLGHKLKEWITPLILKVPLLSTLFRIINQISHTLQDKDAFRKTVIVEFNGLIFVGFVTLEHPKVFEEVLNKHNLVTVFIPTTPNPTNGFLVMLDKNKVIYTDIPTSDAISFVVTMGTAMLSADSLQGGVEELIKSSQVSEWDFFWNNICNAFIFHYPLICWIFLKY